MQRRYVLVGWGLLTAALVGAGAVAAPPTTTPATTPRKMDAREIEAVVHQGLTALAADDFKLARDAFLDATQADAAQVET